MRARVFQGVDPYAFQCCIFSVLSAGVRQPSPRSAASPPAHRAGEKGAAPLPITWSEFARANYIAGVLLCLSALM